MIDDLPASCALIACAACYELAHFGIQCRPLAVTYRRNPVQRHIITVFVFESRLRAYDHYGSSTLPPRLTMSSRPKAIAEAWLRHPGVAAHFPYKVLSAAWY